MTDLALFVNVIAQLHNLTKELLGKDKLITEMYGNIVLSLWHNFGSMECMYVRMYVCMYVCIYMCMYVCMAVKSQAAH